MRMRVNAVLWTLGLVVAVVAALLVLVGRRVEAQNFPIMDVRERTWGTVLVTDAAALSDALANPTAPQIGSNQLLWDTVQWVRSKAAALATYPVSTTTTARSIVGANIVEKSSRWTVVSFPAAGTVGSASLAAEVGVRHVIDCISFAADASAAVTAAAGNVAIRDGATGAGTVIWQFAVAHAAAAAAGVQTVAPHSFCGLNLVGTTNTAMTAEFNAGVVGEVQSVSISGFNVQ